MPLLVFSPQAIAVAAAAESVMMELADFVRVVAWYGSAFMASGPWPVFSENSSATMRCGMDMPSPMNKNAYLGLGAPRPAMHNPAAKMQTLFFMGGHYTTISPVPQRLVPTLRKAYRAAGQNMV